MRTFSGGCHCGALRVAFETAIPPEELEVRECQCTFCRKHGSRTGSDPGGRVTISAADAAQVSRYQFNLRTCEFLVCGRCGVYVAAVLGEGADTWAVVNLNVLDERAAFSRPPIAMDYTTQDASTRIARRMARWTPATVHAGAR